VIEQKINKFFGDDESTGFGTGWWSGILSAFFGFLSFGGVLCLHFPQLLTSAEFRPFYSLHAIRLLIQFLIVAAVAFGVISSLLRKKKTLALTGMLLAIAATAWGGSSVKVNGSQLNGMTIGMDWFLLDLLPHPTDSRAGENVTTAALEVGYSSPSAFISMFRKQFGTTPMRYLGDGKNGHERGE
jgi:AraC-like DNA-binding protein